MPSSPPIHLSSDALDLRIDSTSGRILAIRNKVSGLDLLGAVLDTPPWRVEIEHQDAWLERFTRFTWAADGPQAVTLTWETEYGLTFTSRVWLDADSIRLTFSVQNDANLPIDKVEYPILSGIGPLVSPLSSLLEPERGHTCLAHSQGTGFLFHDPLRTFLPEAGPKQGLRYSPYPEGFNGSTMQFMAYYAVGQGGFYFATRDSGRAMKWFNFFKDVNSAALMASIMHQAPAVQPGLSFTPGYQIEISNLYRGDWYEAAEKYKSWAIRQPWTQQGTLLKRRARPDHPAWLFDELGACTFGVNAGFDRARWLETFRQISGRPLLHVLGSNWARVGQDYMNHLPGGLLEDWLPARFSDENIAAIRRAGDYWVPFEFDLLCSHSGEKDAPVLEHRQVLPEKKYSFDRYWFPFMCPATDYWREFHVRRDAALVGECGADGVYYDISANNVLMACRSKAHGHAPGGGEEIAGAFARQIAETRDAMAQAAGRALPVGTEMITELLIPHVDFYQARAEASPLSAFEGDFWRAWIIDGRAEKIPLFACVYHEYGPVRMDGWAKLAAEAGDLFYWVAARVALWGGLFELNYEFSALENLDGLTDDPAEHYYHFTPRDYPIDPAKAAYVNEVAEARAGWANAYLAYGTMLRPPAIVVPKVSLDYFLYNAGKDFHSYEDRGSLTVPGVICAAWGLPDGRAAVFLANLLPDPQTLTLPLDPAAYGLQAPLALVWKDREGEKNLGRLDGPRSVEVTLPARRIGAVEMRAG